MDFVAQVADRVVVLLGGKIDYDGSALDLFSNDKLIQKADLEIPALITATKELNIPLPPSLRELYDIETLSR